MDDVLDTELTFRGLLLDIAGKLTQEDTDELKFLIAKDVTEREEEKAEDKPLRLFKLLMQKKLISENNLGYLDKIFKKMIREDIRTMIKDYISVYRQGDHTKSLLEMGMNPPEHPPLHHFWTFPNAGPPREKSPAAGMMPLSEMIPTTVLTCLNQEMLSSTETSSIQEKPGVSCSGTRTDFKLRLQEYTHKNKMPEPSYKPDIVADDKSPENGRMWTCKVVVNGREFPSNGGFVRRIQAEQSAAQNALTFLQGNELPPPPEDVLKIPESMTGTITPDGPVDRHTSTETDGAVEDRAPSAASAECESIKVDLHQTAAQLHDSERSVSKGNVGECSKVTHSTPDKLIPEKHKDHIRRSLETIVKKLFVGESLVLNLISEGIVQQPTADEIRHDKVQLKKCTKLMDHILGRPLDDLGKFLQILCKLNQHHVARIIEPRIGIKGDDNSGQHEDATESYHNSISTQPHREENQGKYRCISKKNKEVFATHRKELIEKLNLSPTLLGNLKDRHLIPEDLLSPNEAEITRKRELIEFIENQSEECLRNFLDFLQADRQFRVLAFFGYSESGELLTDEDANPPAIDRRNVSVEYHLPPVSSEHQLCLHDYQEELAQEALRGENSIICSPTGSGKTIVAAFIAQDLRRRCLETKGRFKALFLVCTRHLVTQQRDAFRQVFTDKHVVEDIPHGQSLEDTLKKHDIIMLTAQIFVNSLNRYELDGNGTRISDYDLLIFDECHHTYYNHPYNTIMRFHQKSKKDGISNLPQIIGLSASLGVGPDEDPKDHYVTICANLDCTQVEHIRNQKNMESMLQLNPRPSVDQIQVVPSRKEDIFISEVKQTMCNFKEKYTHGAFGRCPELGTQAYQQWAVANIDATKKTSPLMRVKRIAFDKLHKLNESLMMYDDLQYEQVKTYLEEYFDQQDLPSEPLPDHKAILEEVASVFQKISDHRNLLSDNPKVIKMLELLEKLSKNPESKGILLTKRRIVNKGLVSIIENHPLLCKQIRVGRLVGKKGGDKLQMTDNEQDEICKKFQKGPDDPDSINLLVATDVAQEGLDIPKCNYVIRYDFVSDEIGSVQSRGRARAKNSECYLIVSEGSINAKREFENLEREHKMMATLSEMDGKLKEMGPMIARKQEELWTQYLNDLENKAKKRETNAFLIELLCVGCHAFLCRGSDIIKKGSHYLCDSAEFLDRVDVYFKEKDEFKQGVKTEHRFDDLIGGMLCKDASCQQKIGVVIKYKNDPFQRKYGYNIACKSVVLKEDSNGREVIYSMKKWSLAPFKPPEEPLGHSCSKD